MEYSFDSWIPTYIPSPLTPSDAEEKILVDARRKFKLSLSSLEDDKQQVIESIEALSQLQQQLDVYYEEFVKATKQIKVMKDDMEKKRAYFREEEEQCSKITTTYKIRVDLIERQTQLFNSIAIPNKCAQLQFTRKNYENIDKVILDRKRKQAPTDTGNIDDPPRQIQKKDPQKREKNLDWDEIYKVTSQIQVPILETVLIGASK